MEQTWMLWSSIRCDLSRWTKGNSQCEFKLTAVDLDGDKFSYLIDWDDGTNTGWSEPVKSGDSITLNHSWSRPNVYTINCKVRDEYGAEISKTMDVRLLPKSRSTGLFFTQFLGRLQVLKQMFSQ